MFGGQTFFLYVCVCLAFLVQPIIIFTVYGKL